MILYKKDFKVNKDFNLARFIQLLDKENFYPFILYIEKLTENQYNLSFRRVKTPIFVTSMRKGNIADEILLSECTLEFLKSADKVRFTASVRNSTTIVIGFLTILFSVPPIFMHTAFAWIPLIIYILGQLLKYRWDVRRYHHIAGIAANT